MKNILEHFGKKLQKQKEDSSKKISQMEARLMTTLDEFEEYIHHGIPVYSNKEQVEMMKNQTKTRKEEEEN